MGGRGRVYTYRYTVTIRICSIPASALLSLQKLWFVDTVLWLCPLQFSSLPILMQESFWWWQCSDRYIISLFPHLHTPFPPSLISLMVSVDVKHRVYILTYQCVCMVRCLLYVHRNRRLMRDGNPGGPPRLSHSSWALQDRQKQCPFKQVKSTSTFKRTQHGYLRCD